MKEEEEEEKSVLGQQMQTRFVLALTELTKAGWCVISDPPQSNQSSNSTRTRRRVQTIKKVAYHLGFNAKPVYR